jgi:alpha-galactosidase
MSDGLYCHANCRIGVLLPGRARRLTALCGVESNRETSPGGGNVVFAVSAGGKDYFRSAVQREGMPVVTIDVALDGQELIILETSDGGLGIPYCQGVWGEAVVTLEDGSCFRLGSLPVRPGLPRGAYEAGAPFSFQYGGQPSAALLKNWGREYTTSRIDDRRTRHQMSWVDPATRLSVRCEGIEYHDYPVVEWTAYLRNDGSCDSPLIESLQGLDTLFERDGGKEEFVLHHHRGSPNSAADFEPMQRPLDMGSTFTLAAGGGRGSNANWPYFNLVMPGDGMMIAVGWPGQWATSFSRDQANGLRIAAGQELTRFVLHPGEEVRTPLMALLFWKGDRVRSHNLWRRWMKAHNVPRTADGALPKPQLLNCACFNYLNLVSSQQEEIQYMDRFLDEKIPLNWWWLDAGWYVNDGTWTTVGTWEADPKRFPGGIRAVTDHAHERGLKFMLWFEPERVSAGSWLFERHPEWLLGKHSVRLLDLGNPAARQWITDHIDKCITEFGIDLYRQDFNIDPLDLWRAHDAPDRQGMFEMGHVTGYLAFWDELRRRHPGLMIDSCASGGRRNDLETMRRAIPLWRTDYDFGDPVGTHSITHGISNWLPYHGGGVGHTDAYRFFSTMTSWLNCAFLVGEMKKGPDGVPNMYVPGSIANSPVDFGALRQRTAQWLEVAEFFLADFYPILPYSRNPADWTGWQFHDPEKGAGMVQLFRHAASVFDHAGMLLQGLDAAANYTVRNLETGERLERSGAQLMEQGLPVAIEQKPGAALFAYACHGRCQK